MSQHLSFSVLLTMFVYHTEARSSAYFSQSVGNNVQVVLTDNIHTSKAFDIVDCAKQCLKHQQCISLFYNTGHGQCILHRTSFDHSASVVTTWRYASTMQNENGMLNPPTQKARHNKLLVVGEGMKPKIPFYQLNLKTIEIDVNPHIKTTRVFAMIYVSYLERVLMGKGVPNEVIAASLDNEDVEIMAKVRCKTLAVDEVEHLVFLATENWEHPYGIAKMKIGGKVQTSGTMSRHVKTIALIQTTSHKVEGMAVDSRHSRLYACAYTKIISIRYDGKDLQTVAADGQGGYFRLIMNDDGDLLYADHKFTLRKLSRSTNTTTTLLYRYHGVSKMVRRDNLVFIIEKSGGDRVHVYNETDGTYKELALISDRSFFVSTMCLIP